MLRNLTSLGLEVFGDDTIVVPESLENLTMPQMDDYIDTTITSAKNYEALFLFNLDFEPIDDLDTFKLILKAIQWKFGISSLTI